MKSLEIRPAKEEDAAIIAKLLYSTENHPEYEWGDGSKEEILCRISSLVKNTNNRYSYKNTKVAVYDNKVCGILITYCYDELNILTSNTNKLLIKFLPGPYSKFKYLLKVGREFITSFIASECYKNEFYISNIATDDTVHGLGIGIALMKEAEDLAKSRKVKLLSLRAKDTTVIKFYSKLNYARVNEQNIYDDSSFRMIKSIC